MRTSTLFRPHSNELARSIPLRVILAPLFAALSIVAGFLQLIWNSDALLALNLISLGLAVWFGMDTKRLSR